MAEMTDKEVEERLSKYRRNKKLRHVGSWIAGVVVAVAVIIGIAVGSKAIAAEKEPVDPMLTKPLVEWTDAEKVDRAELYADRLSTEPVQWRHLLKTGFTAPGKRVIHGKVLRATLWGFVFSIAGNIVICLLGVLTGGKVGAAALVAVGRIWYLLEALFSLWVLVLVAALLWRAFLA